MKMPRNGFDSLAAVARLNTNSTSHHRERWPSLAWVWDELDELRRWQDEAIDAEDYAALEAERDALSDVAEQRDALSQAVRLLLEPEPDMECVQAVLMGGWA
jgi:hypothetical protein